MATLAPPQAPTDAPVLARLSLLDRFLPVWIVVAMAAGIGLGRAIPGLNTDLDKVRISSVSLPIAIGLLLMMYPVLAKVRYSDTRRVTSDRRLLGASLVLNWLVGPAVMFTLAWLLLPDLPTYRTGLIIVGLARCIAMVLIWNDLSCGDSEAAATLVAINSVFQIIAFAGLGYFYLELLPGWLGLGDATGGAGLARLGVWAHRQVSVLIFLGIPLLAGFLTRVGTARRRQGPRVVRRAPSCPVSALPPSTACSSPSSCSSPSKVTPSPTKPLDVARIALPLLAYFAIMFGGRVLRPRTLPRPQDDLRAHHHAGVHRCRQQLRARDRRVRSVCSA